MAGILAAFVIPLLLTATLFLGPICAIIINGVWKLYLEPVYWIDSFTNILWIRNHIVAPLSEEFTFRACMMPLLLQSYRPMTAVLLTPLFFGVAHLHHNVERVRSGMDWKTALIVSSKNDLSLIGYIFFFFFSIIKHQLIRFFVLLLQHFNLPIPEYLAFIQHIYLQKRAILLHHL